MTPRAATRAGMALLGLVIVTAADEAAAQNGSLPVGIVGTTPRSVSEGVLDLLSYSVVPDGTVSTLQMDRSGEGDNDIGVTLGQIGAGFTWSDSVPVYLEGFIGYARYDPRFVFSDGQEQRRISTRWDQFSVTVGVGYDFLLAKNIYLRPIANAAVAQVTTDAALAGSLIEFRSNQDLAFLERGKMNAYGLGGSLVLAYYDHLPAREIDIELRATDLYLQTFGDTSAAVEGDTNALTVNLWARLRWPTGLEAFQRPVRWVTEAQHSRFLGDPQAALGFEHLTKIGGGLELDLEALKIGAFGLYTERVRLVGRYVFGLNVTGFSVGLGITF
jgi:Autotransporter beta-domain